MLHPILTRGLKCPLRLLEIGGGQLVGQSLLLGHARWVSVTGDFKGATLQPFYNQLASFLFNERHVK